MTLPTTLTVLRMFLAVLIVVLLFVPGWVAHLVAFGLFLLASGTDWLDGYLARRWQQTTPLGALLDPIADKVLVLALFVTFAAMRLMPWWMALVVVIREVLITTVRLLAAHHQVILSAAKEGKQKMVSQIVTLTALFSLLIAQEFFGHTGRFESILLTMERTVTVCLWVTVLLTAISGVSFFWRHGQTLRTALWTHR